MFELSEPSPICRLGVKCSMLLSSTLHSLFPSDGIGSCSEFQASPDTKSQSGQPRSISARRQKYELKGLRFMTQSHWMCQLPCHSMHLPRAPQQ